MPVASIEVAERFGLETDFETPAFIASGAARESRAARFAGFFRRVFQNFFSHHQKSRSFINSSRKRANFRARKTKKPASFYPKRSRLSRGSEKKKKKRISQVEKLP
ncbi:MAG TPA: hypothetical protein VIL74_13155 [Pyrinomonadaceae bacterium]|jgi:hypothetical protein